VEAARHGDAVALEVVEDAARAIAVGIAAVLQLLNLRRVVLGGGVAAAGAFLLDRIATEVARRTYAQVFADCEIRTAALEGDAGAIGAARVAMTALPAPSP
jgi:glucokinase